MPAATYRRLQQALEDPSLLELRHLCSLYISKIWALLPRTACSRHGLRILSHFMPYYRGPGERGPSV